MLESVRWYRAFMEHETVTVRMTGVESETTSDRLGLPPHDRDGLKRLETWLELLAEVEMNLGRHFAPPDAWTPINGKELTDILAILRSRRGTADFGSATITIPRDKLVELEAVTDSISEKKSSDIRSSVRQDNRHWGRTGDSTAPPDRVHRRTVSTRSRSHHCKARAGRSGGASHI